MYGTKDPSMREAEWLDEGYPCLDCESAAEAHNIHPFYDPPGGRALPGATKRGASMENIWRRRPCALSCWSALDADGCCALRAQA